MNTVGLDGLDFYVFSTVQEVVGARFQTATDNPVNGTSPFNDTDILVGPMDFLANPIDQLIVGSNQITKLGFRKQVYIDVNNVSTDDFVLSDSLVAPLDQTQLADVTKKVECLACAPGTLNSAAPAGSANVYASVSISYSSDVISTFTETPPTTASILGCVTLALVPPRRCTSETNAALLYIHTARLVVSNPCCKTSSSAHC